MRLKFKSLALLALVFVALWYTVPLAYAVLTSRAPSGTIYGNAKSVVTFTQPVGNCLSINNRHASTVAYFKVNDTGTSATATVSATVYDFALDSNELLVLDSAAIGKFPISSVGIYTAATTPVLRLTGW